MKKRRLLVVDDEPEILSFFQRLLQEEFSVTVALGGDEAIACCETQTFDIVLTDVRMAGTDGLMVLEHIKESSPDSMVLLMSGYPDMGMVIDALNEGAFAFVTKPVIRDVLLNRLDQAVAVIQRRENEELVLRELKTDLLMQSRFSQRLSALAAMAGGIAHELHQPLSGINLYVGTVKGHLEKKGAVEPAFLLETLKKIDQQVERAIAVIEHIREFSAGSGEPEVVELRLKEAAHRGLDLFNYQLEALGIELSIQIPEDLTVRTDKNGFEQVLINLVSNAKDSIVEKQREAAETIPSKIEIVGRRERSEVLLDLKDSGGGIPEGLKNVLFEPFVSGKKNRGGSGLGLFICKRMMEEQGAAIDLLSTGREGSTFRLRFPANPHPVSS